MTAGFDGNVRGRMELLRQLPFDVVTIICQDLSGGWFGGGVGVVVEGGGESVDGVVLEAAADVGIGAGGDVDVDVAEDALDGFDVDSGFEQEGGAGVFLFMRVVDDIRDQIAKGEFAADEQINCRRLVYPHLMDHDSQISHSSCRMIRIST